MVTGVLLSAALQIVIFPLPNLYWLRVDRGGAAAGCHFAVPRSGNSATGIGVRRVCCPLRHGRGSYSVTLRDSLVCRNLLLDLRHHAPLWRDADSGRRAGTDFVLYVCRAVSRDIWAAAGAGGRIEYLAAAKISMPATAAASIRRALVAAPFLWVAVELARTRITAFPWELLGYSQTANFALTRITTLVGVYGLSFEILLVNSVFAAAFWLRKEQRKRLLVAACVAAVILQAGQLLAPPPAPADHTALLVQPNIPIQGGAAWTKEYFQNTLRDLTAVSLHPREAKRARSNFRRKIRRAYDLIVWPESPSPFYTNDPLFRDAVSALARQSGTWVVAGSIGITPAMHSGGGTSQIFNSAALVNPEGEWIGRYDKVHLVPFGEYLPFPQLFAFAGGLTKEVGEFQRGTSHAPLDAGGERLGIFICYESIFPTKCGRGRCRARRFW